MDEILKGKIVLVVDDTGVARMLAADILGAVGIEILEAESGEQALKYAAEKPVDAFLLDIKLPDMNGMELCRSLRAMEAYRNAPIIFVTALDQREVLQWAIEAGADDFIQKPLHAMVLRRRLANLLQKASYLKKVESMGLSLRRYVSPRTEEIARVHATHGKLPAPRRQDACILFSDARGFSELSPEPEPEDLFSMLSSVLAAQVAAVNRHDGYVDKFSGDGVMAVFDSGNMAAKCCSCALAILDHSKRFAAQKGMAGIRLGIGIHMGPVVVGNLGSDEYLDYTLVGTSVNLAARLCGLARQSIVVSQAVRDAAANSPGLAFQSERPATVRGFKDAVTVYDLLRAPA
jgi:class 3 adenylate cyclase/CheY-like chemotaxis protein